MGPAKYSNIIERISLFANMIDLADQEFQLLFLLSPESDRFKGLPVQARDQCFFHAIHIMADAGIGQV